MTALRQYLARAKHATRAYRLHYVVPRVTAPLQLVRPALDHVFILDAAWRGWILDAICREIARHVPGRHHFHYSTMDVPAARSYFIAHQSLVAPVLSNNPCVWRGRRVGFYTHPSEILISQGQFIYALNQLHGMLFMCSEFRDRLIAEGLEPGKTAVVHGGADRNIFTAHKRGGGAVGFSMAYYPRKSPERLIELVSLLAPLPVILIGRNWNDYPDFDRLRRQPNFTYIEAPYSDYPNHYAKMDVFVSLAQLEGGPIPLIETMMCNVVPVASRTGFAPDLITHGANGFLFDVNAPAATIAGLVQQAFAHQGDVRASVEHLTWDRFARHVERWLH